MAAYIMIPKLGMSTSEATLVEWKAKEGDWVEKGSVVLEIETEKIKSDIEAEASGFLHILVEEGVKAPVGRVVGLIAETREELEALQKEPPKEIFTTVREVEEAPSAAATQAEAVAPSVAKPTEGEHIRISPVARKMAEEHMIDITKVTGTGPGGRIVREDIEKAIAAKEVAHPEEAPKIETLGGKRVKFTIPLKGMRRAIAEHLHRSLAESAQLTALGEIDMTELIKLRKDLLAREDVSGARITYTDMFVFAVAKVLKEKPMVNSSLIGNEIKVWEDINIGVAVALQEGLIVPVVKNADQKSIVEISKSVRTLAEKAREGKLMPDEVTGGTFTITNLGAAGAGWRFETAIINQPETAILGTGGVTDRAVVRDGQIVIRPIMTYSFTYDHRVIDGTLAVQFMARVIELLETPRPLLP
jgi:pyruvate dehydrogenase E2 component (dihydrolipoamide acetyltransferase)/2-oxoglutarate dehydrogenase E2 component (dihydrolipoamide succinyltransferase)